VECARSSVYILRRLSKCSSDTDSITFWWNRQFATPVRHKRLISREMNKFLSIGKLNIKVVKDTCILSSRCRSSGETDGRVVFNTLRI
jgi:hypothetical protein